MRPRPPDLPRAAAGQEDDGVVPAELLAVGEHGRIVGGGDPEPPGLRAGEPDLLDSRDTGVHGRGLVRTGLLTGPDDPGRVIDTKIVGPADSFGFQVIAGEHVGAGAWMHHCHVQSHSDMGRTARSRATTPMPCMT
jgi:hypothetical protein